MRNILLATTVVAGVAAFAGAASAQTATGFNVLGGGSSLAANLYNRTAQAIAGTTNVGTVALNGGLNTVGAIAGSTQGELGYQADGSGSGQKAFIQQTLSTHTLYNGLNTALPGNGLVAFGASDAYLTSDQVACWSGTTANCTAAGYATPTTAPSVAGGNIIQIPAFGTAVAVAHTNQYSKPIKLNDDDLCGIFSGKITDWSNVSAGSAKDRAGQAGTISVVVRSDGSGTSFLFTQHLAKVCTSTNTASGVTFVATKTFASVFPSSTLPSNFTGASGSTAVADALLTGTNLVSYLTPDFTSIAPVGLSHFQKLATLGGVSVSTLVAGKTDAQLIALALTSPYQYIKYASVYNTTEGKYYYPNTGSTTKALSNPGATDYAPGYPTTKVNAQDATKWIPSIAQPAKGYPIVGYTALLFPTCYANSSVANYVKSFLTQLYNSGNKTNLTAEGFVGVPSGYSKTI